MGCEKRTFEKNGRICPKEYCDADCAAACNYNVLPHTARQAIFGLLRLEHARLPFGDACHRLRVKGRKLFLLSRRADGKNLQNGKKRGFGACVHHLSRLDADCQRYGAVDLSTPRLSRTHEHTERKIHDFHVRHAEYRGESRRHVHPIRQSAKPLSILQIQYPHARIYGNYGNPLCSFRAFDYGVLFDFRQKRTARVRGCNRQTRTQTNGSVFDFIYPFRHHGIPRNPLLDRAADYSNRSLDCRLESGCKGGLSPPLHVRIFLYLCGEYGAHRTRAKLLFLSIGNRHSAVQRAFLSDYQQRAVGNSFIAIYMQLSCPFDWCKYRRRGNAHFLACKLDYLSGILLAQSGKKRKIYRYFLRIQLLVFNPFNRRYAFIGTFCLNSKNRLIFDSRLANFCISSSFAPFAIFLIRVYEKIVVLLLLK